jgi:Ni,Fe-hydrogenase maturation factor
MDDLCQQLERCLHGRVCLIGLGNPDYADDGFGVCMAKALFDSGMPDVVVAETSPEKFIGEITASDFDNVLFVDAVELGTTPGSLSLLAEWAESSGTSKAWLLGIQPKSLKPGSGLSDEVQKSLDAVKELILNLRVRDLESTIDVVT